MKNFKWNKKTIGLALAAALVVILLFCFGGPKVRNFITEIANSALGTQLPTTAENPTSTPGSTLTDAPEATLPVTDATLTPEPTKEPTATPAPTDKPTSTPKPTKAPTNTPTVAPTKAPTPTQAAYVSYYFRNKTLLDQHFEKHGKPEMGFKSAKDYEKAASDVINNPKALHKLEKDGENTAYYIEETNEFVVLSADGYIRTYFNPSAGKSYYDRQ